MASSSCAAHHEPPLLWSSNTPQGRQSGIVRHRHRSKTETVFAWVSLDVLGSFNKLFAGHRQKSSSNNWLTEFPHNIRASLHALQACHFLRQKEKRHNRLDDTSHASLLNQEARGGQDFSKAMLSLHYIAVDESDTTGTVLTRKDLRMACTLSVRHIRTRRRLTEKGRKGKRESE